MARAQERSLTISVLALLLVACAASGRRTMPGPAELIRTTGATWTKLDTAPYRGKQDDIFFLNAELGWYVNGGGKIYKTTDGGRTWSLQLEKPGTFFRAVGFLDERHGFAGNIGIDYFPGVTDETPLYETLDGGDSWAPVRGIALPKAAGVCAIAITSDAFVNAGHLDHRQIIDVAGRVGGPAFLLRSFDQGKTWRKIDLNQQAAMILDVKFFDANTGIVVAGSDREIARSHALILRTTDGGATWAKVYESARAYEISWKASFPTRDVGYATVMSYNEDPKTAQRFVAKTTDNGRTWRELLLVSDLKQQEFGIAFVSPEVGWVGAMDGGYQTLDGGRTFTPVAMGRAVNKIRAVATPEGFVGYAIGLDVYKLDARRPIPGAWITSRP